MLMFAKDLRLVAALAIGAAISMGSGCGQRDEIARYTVSKPELVDPTLTARAPSAGASTERQTLGLIVPVEETGWFFKLTGDKQAVEPQHEAFLQFITSIKFSSEPDAKPSWKLPAGWQERPGSQMRFATIAIDAGGQPLELSVIPLPRLESNTQQFVLDNVNRWRDQLKLPAIAAADLASTTKTMSIDGREATLVSIVGTGSGGMGGGAPFAPFAGGAGAKPLPADHPPLAGGQAAGGGKATGSPADIHYDAPAEWQAAKTNPFSVAAFHVADGEKQADITVSSAGGDLLANVNRWRAQVDLEPVDAEGLAKSMQTIDTLGTKGDYVQLVGSGGETILGVVATAGGRTWFVKLKGDSDLAGREKGRFESFVKSLRLP